MSILVRPRITITTREKLVASKGQFVTVSESFGEIPNGTAWAITTAPEPGLDATNLVVGRVVEGMDVVRAVAALPRVKNNEGSLFFKAGKVAGAWAGGRTRECARAPPEASPLPVGSSSPVAPATGDKRADVAERAFNKPFAKVLIEECWVR